MPEPQQYLTPEGKAKVKAELEDLVKNKRPALAKRLREAIQQGDLSENADYHAAKEDQAFLEGKVLELEAILRHAVIIADGPKGGDMVQVGSRITVEESGDRMIFMVVGAKEASPREGKISNESPVGKALLGRRVGEVTRVQTPAGEVQYKVVKIE